MSVLTISADPGLCQVSKKPRHSSSAGAFCVEIDRHAYAPCIAKISNCIILLGWNHRVQPLTASRLSFPPRHQERIDTCSLVLSAKNISHHIRQDDRGTMQIICAPEIAERARYQLNRYLEENRNWPPPQLTVHHPSFPALLPTACPDRGPGLFFHGYRSLEAGITMV